MYPLFSKCVNKNNKSFFFICYSLEPGETHQLCVELRDEQIRYIKKLECEVGAQDKNFGLLQNEYDRLVCRYG